MSSSDLHGAEEPIRWTLGWQLQDRVYDEPTHTEEEERPHQDVYDIDCGLWGISPWQMAWTIMDRTPPVMIGRFPGHVAALIY
jgi:hypothetical protein